MFKEMDFIQFPNGKIYQVISIGNVAVKLMNIKFHADKRNISYSFANFRKSVLTHPKVKKVIFTSSPEVKVIGEITFNDLIILRDKKTVNAVLSLYRKHVESLENDDWSITIGPLK